MIGFVADLRFRFERRENADSNSCYHLFLYFYFYFLFLHSLFVLVVCMNLVQPQVWILAVSRLDGTHALLDLLLFRESIHKRRVPVSSVERIIILPTASPGLSLSLSPFLSVIDQLWDQEARQLPNKEKAWILLLSFPSHS